MGHSTVLLIVAVILPNVGLAYRMVANARLDHALWPEHEAKLVVAGVLQRVELKDAGNLIDGPPRYVTVHFRVESVILGAKKFVGKTLELPATAFVWPEDLVPLREKTFCIFVLRESSLERKDIATPIAAIVPARQRAFERVNSTIETRKVLADEIVAQLAAEKSDRRMRDMLLQVAPILKKEQASAIEPFAQSKNPWVKRAALACLIYATEDAKWLKAAAQDVQTFVEEMRKIRFISDLGQTEKSYPPRTLFNDHYFFLEKSTWTVGTHWNREEAEKHLRILRGMLQFGIISDDTRKLLETGGWSN